MVVMAPKDEEELRHMVKTAVDYPGPVALRYPRGKGVGVEAATELTPLALGKGELLREGEDVLILGIGSTVMPSLRAAEKLEDVGIRAAVINARFLKPLDGDLIGHWAARTGKVVTVEENVLQGGFGSAVLELLQEMGLWGIRVKRLGIPDCFVEHGPQPLLRAKYGIDEEGILKGAKEMVEERGASFIDQRNGLSASQVLPHPK
jgi:1-deoxy-D-xylulose-5-phosphate synthase